MSLYSRTVIDQAEVIEVNPDNFSVTVQTINTFPRTFYNVQWICPYVHNSKGQGIYGMPEIGSKCLINYSVANADGEEIEEGVVTIMGFYVPSRHLKWGAKLSGPDGGEEDRLPKEEKTSVNKLEYTDDGMVSYRNRREKLIPGDIVCGKTSSGNKIILFTGGVTQITANSLCQRLYISYDNWIRDFCQNYIMSTDGGYFKWTDDLEGDKKDPILKTTIEKHIRSTNKYADSPQDFKTFNVINSFTGYQGDMIFWSMAGPKDITLPSISEAFRFQETAYPTYWGEGGFEPTTFVRPYRLDLVKPGKEGIREKDPTPELPKDANLVAGFHLQGGIEDKQRYGRLSFVNRNDINISSEGSGNLFFNGFLNTTVNESYHLNVGFSSEEGDQHHKVVFHAQSREKGGRLFIWAKGLGSPSEFEEERLSDASDPILPNRNMAFDLRVGTGHILNIVENIGNIQQQINHGGHFTRNTTAGFIRDQVSAGGGAEIGITHKVYKGMIANQVQHGGIIFNKNTLGDIQNETAFGRIVNNNFVGQIVNNTSLGIIQNQTKGGIIRNVAAAGLIQTQMGTGDISNYIMGWGRIISKVTLGVIDLVCESPPPGGINLTAQKGYINIYGLMTYINCFPSPTSMVPIVPSDLIQVKEVPDIQSVKFIPNLEAIEE